MIKAPEHNFIREVSRTLVEAVAQITPLTGAAARIFQFTRPTQYEKERETWILEITEKVNAHEDMLKIFQEYLSPKISISEDALALAKILIDTSKDGCESFIGFEELKDIFSELTKGDFELAIAELQDYEFVFNDSCLVVWRKLSLYVAFDRIFNNVNVEDDAKKIAKLLLEDKSNGIVARLFEATAWDRRRFNPALGYLLHCLPESSFVDEMGSGFPAAQIFLNADVRFSLMKFVK